MNRYKRFLLISIFMPMPLFIILGILMYLYDPLQVWHKPYFRETRFFGDAYIQNKAIIDFYPFDSIILGSSVLASTQDHVASEKLGSIFANLSLPGSNLSDKSTLLSYALKKRPIKDVIISLDWLDNIAYKEKKWEYLYDDNSFNDIELYINFRFIGCALIWSSANHCIGARKSYFNTPELQPDIANTQDPIKGAKDWLQRDYNKKRHKDIYKKLRDIHNYDLSIKPIHVNIERYEAYFEKHILSIAKAYPNTMFHLIIPTYSRLTYKLRDDVSNFYQWRIALRLLVELSHNITNIRIYGLDNLDYADNLGNYFDTIHYSRDMNLMQLDSIKSKTHVINTDNIDSYLSIMQEKITRYNLTPLIKIVHDLGL